MAGVRTWIDTHTDQVIIILSLGLGFWLVGKSIYQLVTRDISLRAVSASMPTRSGSRRPCMWRRPPLRRSDCAVWVAPVWA